MPDQSASTSVLEIDEIKLKIAKNDNLTDGDLEKLKVYARNPKSSLDLAQTTGFIEKLTRIIFADFLKSEGLKILINIATNESSSRCSIAKATEQGIKKSFQTTLTLEHQFLLFRLLFLLSIDFEGANLFSNSIEIENFIAFDTKELTDNSETGKITIDILRFRYNLTKNGLIEHEKAVDEATREVIDKCDVRKETINVLGSCLNISLGNGPENVIYKGKIEQFLEIFKLIMNMYLIGENEDYLGTALMIAVKLAAREEYRKIFRKTFLPSQNNGSIHDWKKLLIVADTSITFLTGEFLLKLCKENVTRFLRHVSFESAAGYLFSKGIFKGGVFKAESPIDPNGESSDEEYFNSNPEEPKNHTSLIPETEEEEQELEYLMKKISEYNAKFQK